MKKNWRNIFFKIVVSTSIIFLLINKIFFFKPGFLEKASNNILYPVIIISQKIASPFQIFLQKKKTYQELKQSYKKIKKQNKNLLTENIKLHATIYHESLNAELLDFQKRYNLDSSIPAKILLKNFTPNEHFFLLNRGEKDGIKKNMIAIYKFQIIGKIIEVHKWHSKLLLITDKNCKVASHTNSTYAQGITIGKNKKNYCSMKYVSYLSKITPNDFIISSGQGLVFPEGFCLGKISKTTTKETYHKIKIKPLVNFDKLNSCLLLNQETIDNF